MTVGGRRLPALVVSDDGRAFVVPLENGWNAYVVAYPRPADIEYAVVCLTRPEADRVAGGEWGIWAAVAAWEMPRPLLEWPRGDWDLLATLDDLSHLPSPPAGHVVRPA